MHMMTAGNSALLREGRPTRIEWGAVALDMIIKLRIDGLNVNNHAYSDPMNRMRFPIQRDPVRSLNYKHSPLIGEYA